MKISGFLAKDAKGIASRIEKICAFPHQEDIRRGIDHIVYTLENPSKVKLRSALGKIHELCIVIEGNPEIKKDLQFLSRNIEREVPPAYRARRRQRSKVWKLRQ